ncbi:MAG TPA: hypothetical protein VLT83_06605 [Opitutaceae bacterium]|nr:hypothetical protein [Opitutaceae bacterium]
MKSPEGEDMHLAFNFKAEGDKLSGSVETPNGDLAVSEGRIKGDEFSFVVDADGSSIDHQGRVSGDTITMKVIFAEGKTAEVTLKRAGGPGAAAPMAADPSGLWKWSLTMPHGDVVPVTLRLELKDGQLTGRHSGRLGEALISDAAFKDGTITFSVVREFDGNKSVIRYRGRLDGDTLKGTVEIPATDGGAPGKLEWNAARVR